jgi:hypothetical protein
MRITVAQVRARVETIAKALAAIPPKDVNAPVNDKVFQDCRRLRQDALDANPDLVRLLPPAFAVQAAGAQIKPHPTWLELRGYCERILRALTQTP